MQKGSVLLFVFLLLMSTQADVATANKDQKFNSTSGCGCHSGGANGVTPVLSGLPTTYTPATTYSLSIGMTGSPQSGGFNLQVSKGALSNPSGAAQVSSNGFQATHNTWTSTSWTVDWTAPSAGTGSVQVNLAVLHGNNGKNTAGDLYGTSSTSVSEDVNTNTPPVASNVALTPQAPQTGDDVVVSYTYSDDDGDGESGTTVAWHLNGAQQSGHTSATLPSSATTKGDSWHAVVTPSDGEDAGTAVASSAVVIGNSAPEVVSIALSSEAPDTNDDVSFSMATEDDDGDAITSTEVRWLLDGAPVSSLENATTLPALATRAGDEWTVEVRVSDGDDTSDWFTSPVATVGSSNQPPAVSDLVLSPAEPTTVNDITAAWVASDPDGDAIVDTEILWFKNDTHQPEADGLNPLPHNFTSKGETWAAWVRVSDGNAWSFIPSSAELSILNAAPVADVATVSSPSFSGLHPLTVNLSATDADGDEVQVVDVRWQLNDVEQTAGAGSLVLPAEALTRDDLWHAVITLDDGTDQTVVSTPSALIVNGAPTVSISWPEQATSLVDLAPSIEVDDVDGDTTTITTTWYKNGFRDAGLANATVVPASKLAPEQTWRLVVEASDGSLSQSTDASVVLVNLAPLAHIDLVSSSVWFNEATVLSAASSSDADGEVVRFIWSWDESTSSGDTLDVVLTQDTTVMLTVFDDSGAASNTTVQLSVEIGPNIQNLAVFSDDRGNVKLTWTWTGDAVAFNVFRNDNLVGTTEATTFDDLPPLSGRNNYLVQPVNDERVFINGADEVSVLLDAFAVEEPGPETGLGFGLGALMLVGLLLAQFMGGRKGGEA